MKINRLLSIDESVVKNCKLHLAIGAKDKFEPLYEFFKDGFKYWQETQNNKNFEQDYILSLIYFAKNEWLFAGLYKKISVIKTKSNKYLYSTELTSIGQELIGKLVVGFQKRFRQSYPHLKNYFDELEILEVLREKFSLEPFPGFENVNVSFDLLNTIMEKEEKSWKTALSNLKGVYLITDTFNGKLYVGSAYGYKAFWNRWKDYSVNGHGGNKKLKLLIANEGLTYASNFQFTILETRSLTAEDDEIFKRESFWKDVFQTRMHGYNIN